MNSALVASSHNAAQTNEPLAVLLFSGGLDSTVLAAHYRRTHRLLLLSFVYGQRNRDQELNAAWKVAAHLGVEHHTVTVSGLGPLLTGCPLTDVSAEVPTVVSAEAVRSLTIPNRNAFITDMAIAIAMARRADVVALALHKPPGGDAMPDGGTEFFDAYREMIRLASRGFHTPRIELPLIDMQKHEVVTYGRQLGAPMDKSWTCFLDGPVHCGSCIACGTRKDAFTESGTPDPTVYDDEADHDVSDLRST